MRADLASGFLPVAHDATVPPEWEDSAAPDDLGVNGGVVMRWSLEFGAPLNGWPDGLFIE
jgi:hypothetical protein